MFLLLLFPVAATKTKVFRLCMTRETLCGLVGLPTRVCPGNRQRLPARRVSGASAGATRAHRRRSRFIGGDTTCGGVRHGTNGAMTLKIAATSGCVPWFDAVFKGGRASEGAYLEHSTQNCAHADTVAARSRFACSTAPARKPALARLSEPPPPASLTARSCAR